ncbi:MAG: hypothetical protein Q8O92_10980 [Candidatus Latescibacter sp.]|nr:hypothetical protein [Candidatus Latescibacter sp.]
MKKSQILPFEYELTDQPITGMGGLPIFLAAAIYRRRDICRAHRCPGCLEQKCS